MADFSSNADFDPLKREWTLEEVEAEAAKLTAYRDAVTAALADKIEANPEACLARAREINARRKANCAKHSQYFIRQWDEILATWSVKEIVDLLRSTDEEGDQIRRMVPLGGLPKEKLHEIRKKIYADG